MINGLAPNLEIAIGHAKATVMKQWCGDISCSRKGSQTNIVKAEPQPGHTLDFPAALPDDPGSLFVSCAGSVSGESCSQSIIAGSMSSCAIHSLHLPHLAPEQMAEAAPHKQR